MRALVYLLILLGSPAALAVDPSILLQQYGHSAWRVQDGYLPSSVYSIAQTLDGYLWVGTQNGLMRFDGVRFVRWAPASGTQLPSSVIRSLLAARDGSLWIATDAGLSRWSADGLTNVLRTGPVGRIVEDRSGTIWVTSDRGGRGTSLCQIAGVETRCFGPHEGVPNDAKNLALDVNGDLWFGTGSSVIRWKLGSQDTYTTSGLQSNEGQAGVTQLAPAPDGSMWVGMTFSGAGIRLQRLMDRTWKPFQTPSLDGSLPISALLLDRQGSLWIGVYSQGLYRVHGKQIEHFRSTDGLSDDFVQNIYEDREGNIWIATVKGIDMFRDVKVAFFSNNRGLDVAEVDAVLPSRDGTVWIGSDSALEALRDDGVSSIRTGKGLPGTQVTSLFEDHAGQFWVGIDDTLSIYKDGKFKPIKKGTDVHIGWVAGISQDVDDNMWAEIYQKGARALLRIRDSKVVEEFPPTQIPAARRIASDPAGGIWLGLMNGDLAKVTQGRVESFQFEQTQASRVEQVAVNPDGSVFGASASGLLGLKNGQKHILSTRNGLPCNPVNAFVWDRLGDLWLDTQCALIQIPGSEMQKWWKHPDSSLGIKVFDVFDGAHPGAASCCSAAGATPDGRLWFGNAAGLQMIDPIHLATNTLPPPVHVEQLVADRKSYSVKEGLEIPPLTRDLQIDYTALSLSVPQRVQFRYKLEGRDRDWQDAGTRRQAFYTDLGPGKYRFRVTACNNDGIWNQTGESLSFSITAAWYQTNWFRLLLVMATMFVLWSAYRLRVRQIATRMSARFDERLAERTRMARELHDTFLQTVQGSKLVADDALDPGADISKMRRALEQLSLWLERATLEARAALHSLRTSTTERNDLALALRRAIEECRLQGSMQSSLTVSGEIQEMHPIVRDDVYRIGYEAIRNACAHSHASQLRVELTYAHNLALSIIDNGVGIDLTVIEEGKEGHFGLSGMRERAARIAGRLSIESSAASGTRIDLVVPGGTIFRNATPRRRSLTSRIKLILGRIGLIHVPTDPND